jgi:hypothetical protein
MSLTTITIRILEVPEPEPLTEDDIQQVSEDFIAGWDAAEESFKDIAKEAYSEGFDKGLANSREKTIAAFDEAVKDLWGDHGGVVSYSPYCGQCISARNARTLRELLFGEPNG